jgi:two-component system, OmpR family, phosphate regulon sensor histidine kinase PhoR
MCSKKVVFFMSVVQTLLCAAILFFAFSLLSFWMTFFLTLIPLISWFIFYWNQKKLGENFKGQVQEKVERDLVFNALMEGIVYLDENMSIQYVNFKASRLLGAPKNQLEGKPFPEKKDSILLEKTKDLLHSCKRLKTPLTDSAVMIGEKKTHLDIIALPQIKHLGFVVIFQDKSSDHKILEVGKDFVSSASHELKTPLTIIKGFAETLQDMKDLPKEIVEEILEKIVRNCQRMDTLVKNLLTLADIESVPLANMQYCDLEDLVTECVRIVSAVYPKARIQIIKKSDSITVEAEPSLLELAILNLVGNAVKYSPDPAQVEISMHQNPDEVQIEIKDSGMGIPAGDIEHIFDRFYTVNKAHSRKLGGAGLGLSLVKTIIEKHEGSIQVSSTLGEGSTFTVCLPSHQH